MLLERIRNADVQKKIISADQAALLFKDGMVVGTSGFTGAGCPKVIPMALAKRADTGDKIGITLITGASVGDPLDGYLARAGVVKRRFPYQTNKSMRDAINAGDIHYADYHLSQAAYWLKNGYFGKIDLAVIEAIAITEEGNIVPTTSCGYSNIFAQYAEKVIVELSTYHVPELEGMHDIFDLERAPHTQIIPIVSPGQRIGKPFISCDPDKIAAVVEGTLRDDTRPLAPPNEDESKIGRHLVKFLEDEMTAGRLPSKLPPLQSGVGAVANAVLKSLVTSKFSDINVYSEVLQDTVVDLIDAGKLACASGTALTISPECAAGFFGNINKYKDYIILRPIEISNNPEVIRRLGVVAMNTAIEVDFSGNVNSTHINGSRLMNGIGGSGDFSRNAALTIFTTASTAKDGALSCIVPHVSHVDHTEHDVHAVITEWGVADLRALDPYERAEVIIANCAHPKFRDELRAIVKKNWEGNTHKHGIPMQSM